jgi:hypothetical protein
VEEERDADAARFVCLGNDEFIAKKRIGAELLCCEEGTLRMGR